MHVVERLVAEKDIAELPRHIGVHPVELPVHFLAVGEKEDVVAELLPAVAPDARRHILRGDFIAGGARFERAVLLPDIPDFVPHHGLVGAEFFPVRPHGRGVVVLREDIAVAAPFAEVAVVGWAGRIEPVAEFDQENRLRKIPPMQLVGDRPHHHRRVVAQPLHQMLHVGLGQLVRRHAEVVAGLGDEQKTHLVRRVIDFPVAGQVVQPNEFQPLPLELADPGLAVFLAALQVAERVPAVPAQENLVSVQVEVRSFPRDLAEAKPLAVPVEHLAVGPHHFGFQEIQMRVVDRPQVRIAPRLHAGERFLRAGGDRQLLRAGPRFHRRAVLFHHAEAQAHCLLRVRVIAHRDIDCDFPALDRGFHEEIGHDANLRNELQKHIAINAPAARIVVLEKPASPRIRHLDPQLVCTGFHGIGDVEFKRHIRVPPIADLLAVHQHLHDVAHAPDMDQDPAVAEIFGHLDRAHIGDRSIGPIVGVVPDIPVFLAPEFVLPRKRPRHAHLGRFFDPLQFEVPSSVEADLVTEWRLRCGLGRK